ncbi:hypothetical protein RJ55_03463 [Drechmeria coniospora]|nr:hypothetical protein RJ55_03463 [Drechmeria coniospora]
MAGNGQSRWADTEEDVELKARVRREKEEKRRNKALKGHQLRRDDSRAAHVALPCSSSSDAQCEEGNAGRDAKRRKIPPQPQPAEGRDRDGQENSSVGKKQNPAANMLRFEAGSWSTSRKVELYEKLNDIEEGTYGWVARATSKATGKIVALKRLKTEPHDSAGLPVTGLREIQILKDCHHPNVVGLEEVVVGANSSALDSSIYLVLEFVEHDLKGILEDMPEPFLASEIKRLLLQLSSGVSYLHDKWILHRDLKTSNLLLNNRGQLKIADFGMARYVGDPLPTKLTQLVVTLWYRAPELLLGAREYGPAIDMWSIGCIFGELITREPLLQGGNEMTQLTKIIELCGIPSETSWPGFRKLPNARNLSLPPTALSATSLVRARFPGMTNAGANLLGDLLSLDPSRRPSAKEMLQHEYFHQDPKPKPESLFPTFPSKAGQERRKRPEPHAPARGQTATALSNLDLSIFQGRENEERGAGFVLHML